MGTPQCSNDSYVRLNKQIPSSAIVNHDTYTYTTYVRGIFVTATNLIIYIGTNILHNLTHLKPWK